MFNPHSVVILISYNQDQSIELGKKCTEVVDITKSAITSDAVTHIDFAGTKSRIIMLPGSEASARSFSSVSLVIADEASRIDESTIHAIRPTLAASRGSMILLSTPFLKQNYYYDVYSNPDSHYKKITVPWYDVPHLTKDFIEQERKEIPDKIFKMEYECAFLDENDYNVFNMSDLDKCVSDEYEVIDI